MKGSTCHHLLCFSHTSFSLCPTWPSRLPVYLSSDQETSPAELQLQLLELQLLQLLTITITPSSQESVALISPVWKDTPSWSNRLWPAGWGLVLQTWLPRPTCGQGAISEQLDCNKLSRSSLNMSTTFKASVKCSWLFKFFILLW